MGVTTIDDVIWGKYAPNPRPLKVGLSRQFQAKIPKYENRTISKTVNPIKPKFEDKAEHHCNFVGGLPLPSIESNMADGRHLENRHDVITLPRIIRFR